jgi:hypothetical protein
MIRNKNISLELKKVEVVEENPAKIHTKSKKHEYII